MYIRKPLRKYIDDVAAKKPIPGGGSVSALCACLAVALSSMVVNFTLGNKRYGAVQAKIKQLLKDNEVIRKKLVVLVDKDTIVYNKLNSALKLPCGNKKRNYLIQKCLKQAALVPFDICRLTLSAMGLCNQIAKIGNANLITDAGCTAYLLDSAYYCGQLNVRINLKFIKDKAFTRNKNRALQEMAKKITSLKKITIRHVEGSL